MFFEVLGILVAAYYIIYYTVLLFLDCDLYLAWKERFGKPIADVALVGSTIFFPQWIHVRYATEKSTVDFTDTLRNKVIWITGASSGIGEHLAYSLARAGCKLILSARREAELFKVKEKCLAANKSLTPDDVEVLVLDVVAIETHEKAFKHVIDKFGKLDILVNNAGRTQRALWGDIEINVDREMFELNVFGVISLSRIALNYFSKRGEGHLAVTSSLAGLVGVPFSATYTATKHALHGYFNALKIEAFGQNIRTTIFCPGPVQTDFLAESFTGKSGEKLGQKTAVAAEKMSAERCGELFAVSLANEIFEAWACYPKLMLLLHISIYYPSLLTLVAMFLRPKDILRMRDSKNVMKLD